MKLINIKNIILDKLNILYFLSSFLSSKGYIYISFAIPRFKKDNYNWGDDINFEIGEIISGKKVIPYRYRIFNSNNYLFIGSVIQWYCNSNSVIWGAGLLHEVGKLEKPKKVLAVRGPLTRNELLKCGIDCPEVYGDPALILPKIYYPKFRKKYKIGLILHYSELNKVQVELPYGYSKEDVLFIDISNYGKWTNFIDEILSCEAILSSSLHGVIVSEAYNVPNLWTAFGFHLASKKSYFKYNDFYLSINKSINEPYFYDNLRKIDNLSKYIMDEWETPEIDLEPLISACPFDDINKVLLPNSF